MAKFPQTRHEMLRAGYTFKSASKCRGCAAAVEWWRTTHGKLMPFNPMPEDHDLAESHWATCPKAEDFRKPAASPLTRLQLDVSALRDRTGARAIVLIHQDGHAAAWQKGIPAEDLRHELITAANEVRNAISKGDQ